MPNQRLEIDAPRVAQLIGVLRQLVEHDYSPEVVALDFEVFSDRWSEGFSARAFFMNESNSEHFIYVNGKAEYPVL